MGETTLHRSAGIQLLEHGSELALELHAGTLPQLFDAAALALVCALRLPTLPQGTLPAHELRAELGSEGAPAPARTLSIAGTEPGALLVHWLREVWYLHDSAHFIYTSAHFMELGPSVDAALTGLSPWHAAVREIQGVTYHELVVTPVGDEWLARVTLAV